MGSVRSLEEIYADFSARRGGLVCALTDDVEQFWSECDPNKENLCLYGAPASAERCRSGCEVLPTLKSLFSLPGPPVAGVRVWRCPVAGLRVSAPWRALRDADAARPGNSDGTWKVGLPVEEVPPELPEPALGVNFARDGMAVRRGGNLASLRGQCHAGIWNTWPGAHHRAGGVAAPLVATSPGGAMRGIVDAQSHSPVIRPGQGG
jgi:hypothetical protein